MSQQHNEIREGDEKYCTRCHKRWGINEDAPPCLDKKYVTLVLEYDIDVNVMENVKLSNGVTVHSQIDGNEIKRCEKLEQELLE